MTAPDELPEHFTRIGLITSQWEVCELYLAELYQILCESENDAPFRCYGALISSSIRFELLGIASATYFHRPSQLRNEIAALFKKAQQLNSQRNKVAHASLMPFIKRRSLKMLQIPLWHQTRRYKTRQPAYMLSVDELRDIASEMTTFALTLKAARVELEAFDRTRRARRARLSRAQARKGQTQTPKPLPPPRSSRE